VTSQAAPDSTDYRSYRPPPSPVPFGYQTGKSYSREEIVGTGKLIAGERFALLPDRLLGFLDSSELLLHDRQSMRWQPRSGIAVLVPPELHDGSERARRGVGLFLRREDGPFVYAGRAEVTNWPVDGNDCWVQLSLDEPLRSPLPRLAPQVELALRRIAPDADREARLRWAAAGDDQAWDELSEELQHQGEVSGDFVPLAPFLLAILQDPTFAHAEDLLWIFALAAKSPLYIRRAATEGEKLFLSLLDNSDPELRRPAAFALHSCERISEQLRPRTIRESDPMVRGAMMTVLGASGDPSNLPLFLQEVQSSPHPFLRAVASVAAIETTPEVPPPEAVRYLKEEVGSWNALQEEWESMDPVGAAPLEPEATFDRLD